MGRLVEEAMFALGFIALVTVGGLVCVMVYSMVTGG